MAFSAGVFSRLYSWVNDKNNGVDIDSTRMDNEMNGMAAALSTCVLKDGTQTIAANLPMNGFRHTGVGNAAARSDYAAAGQIQDGTFAYFGTAGGTGTAQTLTPAPALPAYVTGLTFSWMPLANTAAATVNINAIGAVAIKKNSGGSLADIASGDLSPAVRAEGFYDGTYVQLLNPCTGVTGYLTAGNNLSDVANAGTALTNLGGLKASNNLSDVSSAGTALGNLGGAPLNSPTFTGSPSLPAGTTAVTASPGDNDTSVATTAFVAAALATKGVAANIEFTGTTTGGGGVAFSNNLSKNRTGTGVYAVTFGATQADTNYTVSCEGVSGVANKSIAFEVSSKSTSGFTLTTFLAFTNGALDPATVSLAVLRYS